MLDFWKRVKKHIAGDFTQAWLCEETDISTTTLSGWVTKDRIPPADKAQAIANALGVTVEYLVTGKQPYAEFEEEPSANYKASDVETPYKTPIALRAHSKELVEIPFFAEQTVSAGSGTEVIENTTGDVIHVEKDWLTNPHNDKLMALTVKGDSMIGEMINNGDIVVYACGRLEGNGIYVITLDGKSYVKRLEFNPIEKMIYIHSANEKYKTMTIPMDYPNYKIEGKLDMWIHRYRD